MIKLEITFSQSIEFINKLTNKYIDIDIEYTESYTTDTILKIIGELLFLPTKLSASDLNKFDHIISKLKGEISQYIIYTNNSCDPDCIGDIYYL